ncbi:MAG: histidine kinase [Alphaproteobacteria bacterium]|nr:MAG: histidine kinase [Alphaproteobacteria bacterium]
MSRIMVVATTFLTAVLAVGGVPAQANPAASDQSSKVRWSVGDNASWASSTFDDSLWSEFEELSAKPEGIFWIRQHLFLDYKQAASRDVVLSVHGTGAFDIYFDGHAIGSSGVVGRDRANEIPGPMRFDMALPGDFLTKGHHVVAMRASAQQISDPADFFLMARLEGARDVFFSKATNLLLLGMAFASVAILSAFMAFTSVWRQQPRIMAATAAATIGISAIVTTEAGVSLGLLTYPQLAVSEAIKTVSALMVVIALPTIVVSRFGTRRWKRWAGGLVIPLLVSLPGWPGLGFDHDARLFICLCLYCLLVCANAATQSRNQAGYYAGSLGLCLLGIVLDPAEMHGFLAALAALLVLGFALDLRTRELVAQSSLLTASRLEAQLLKKNIEPHFMMNSLTVISEWIETTPQAALRYIDGLADELRSLSKMSNKQLIPLSEELDLCRTHLRLMGMRKKKSFCLETKGLDGNEAFPPAVFHTLLENALSHNRYEGEKIEFKLTKSLGEGKVRFDFVAPVGLEVGHANLSSGAGTRYIEARLEESFPGRWTFSSARLNDSWYSSISIME